MAETVKTRVFMSGRSQHVTIPAEYRFAGKEVFLRRDERNGDLILSQCPATWEEIYAALTAARIPDDFLADRDQGVEEERAEL